MKAALPDFSNLRLLVAGDIMLDRYWIGATSRISPEAPVPVVRIGEEQLRAGGAGNVALNVAALGAQVSLLGLVGADEAAKMLQQLLVAGGVDCHFSVIDKHPTIAKLRVMSRKQQLIRMDFEEAFGLEQATQLNTSYEKELANVDAVILSDYGKGSLLAIEHLIALARQHGLPVIVDPKGRQFERYRGASLVKPNFSEFIDVVGECASEEVFAQRGEELRAKLDLQALLVTRSEQGMSLFEKARPLRTHTTQAREVFDVTGAGDTVAATLGVALAAKCSYEEAMAWASLTAGIVVGKSGTAVVHHEELGNALINRSGHFMHGIVDAQQLHKAFEQAQRKSWCTVIAEAPAELDEIGLRYLAEAAAGADFFAVVANSALPAVALNWIAALGFVDMVCVGDDGWDELRLCPGLEWRQFGEARKPE